MVFFPDVVSSFGAATWGLISSKMPPVATVQGGAAHLSGWWKLFGDGGTLLSRAQIDDSRNRTPLSQIAGRYTQLKKAGNEYVGLCPFHTEKTPSFFVNDRKGLYHCWGCEAKGDAITLMMALGHLSFDEAVKALSAMAPVWPGSVSSFEQQFRASAKEYAERGSRQFEPDRHERERIHKARALWQKGVAITGTLAERYLREQRGYQLHQLASVATSLRFVESLWCQELQKKFPALIACIKDSSEYITAVQRTWLNPETGEAIVGDKGKLKRTFGPMHDGAVKLGLIPDDQLGLAEGVEDALSVYNLYWMPTWAVLSHNRFTAVKLPKTVKRLILFGDNTSDATRADPLALEAADRWETLGIEVKIETPPFGYKDWNDFLRKRK